MFPLVLSSSWSPLISSFCFSICSFLYLGDLTNFSVTNLFFFFWLFNCSCIASCDIFWSLFQESKWPWTNNTMLQWNFHHFCKRNTINYRFCYGFWFIAGKNTFWSKESNSRFNWCLYAPRNLSGERVFLCTGKKLTE